MLAARTDGLLSVEPPPLTPSNMAHVRQMLEEIPTGFEFCYEVDADEMNALMESGFFAQPRVLQSGVIHIDMYTSESEPHALDWYRFADLLLFEMPNRVVEIEFEECHGPLSILVEVRLGRHV
ncbi:hypothetical protein AAVH_12227 [Aphelenchoides avenae]|nr:hypothetical protein AAVH_12227 [Aphelenchus avenae]